MDFIRCRKVSATRTCGAAFACRWHLAVTVLALVSVLATSCSPEDEATTPANAKAPNLKKTVTYDEALALFAEITSHKDVAPAMRYLEHGCQARALWINRFLDSKGIDSGKVFYLGDTFLYHAGQKGVFTWPTHIVATLLVQKGDRQVRYALDTGLFTEPVEVTSWVSYLRANARVPDDTTSSDFETIFTAKYVYVLDEVSVKASGIVVSRRRANLRTDHYQQDDLNHMELVLADTGRRQREIEDAVTRDPALATLRESNSKTLCEWFGMRSASCRSAFAPRSIPEYGETEHEAPKNY